MNLKTIMAGVAVAGLAVLSIGGGVLAANEGSPVTSQTQFQNEECTCEQECIQNQETICLETRTRQQERLQEQTREQLCVENQECLQVCNQNRVGPEETADDVSATSGDTQGNSYGESGEGTGPGEMQQYGSSSTDTGNSYGEPGDGTGPGEQRQYGKSAH